MQKNVTRVAALAVSLMGAASAVQAADISWAVGPSFNGASGFQAILTNGTLVDAVDIGSGAVSRTVDPGGLNVTFRVVDPSFLAGFIFDAGSPNSTDAGWNAVIDDADWNGAGDHTVANFLTGLSVGETYQLQLFASDSRGCCNGRTSRFGDGNAHFSATVVQGSFTSLVGTFVADASSQALEFDTSSNAPILNAYVLRQTSAVPLPAAWLMLLPAAAIATTRRRRVA